MWVLGLWTPVLMLAWQVFLLGEPSAQIQLCNLQCIRRFLCLESVMIPPAVFRKDFLPLLSLRFVEHPSSSLALSLTLIWCHICVSLETKCPVSGKLVQASAWAVPILFIINYSLEPTTMSKGLHLWHVDKHRIHASLSDISCWSLQKLQDPYHHDNLGQPLKLAYKENMCFYRLKRQVRFSKYFWLSIQNFTRNNVNALWNKWKNCEY